MRTTVYIHGSKEYMYDKGQELGLTGEALKNFMYTCYEVEIELEVNMETGDSKIISVDGKELKND